MFAIFLTSSLSHLYKIIGVDKDQKRIPFAAFNLDENTRTVKAEKLTLDEFEANQIELFEIERPDGQILTVNAPKYTSTISFNLITNFENYPVSFEVKSSSSRKSVNAVTIKLRRPSKEYAPHKPAEPQQQGGFPWMLAIPAIIIFMMCMRAGAPQ